MEVSKGSSLFKFRKLQVDEMTPPSKKRRTDDIVVVDHRGDLVIHFQENSVQVSSRVLSLASPVFESMFNGDFKESLKNSSSSQDKHEISLPEDDFESFIIWSRVIHFRSNIIEGPPTSSTLLTLACLCEKYQSMDTMALHLREWIDQYPKDMKHTKENLVNLANLLLASYICDFALLFKSISKDILTVFRVRKHGVDQRNSWYSSLDHPLVRHPLSEEFEFKHETINRGIHNIYNHLFQRMKFCSCNGNRLEPASLRALLHANLMPTDLVSLPIEKIMLRIERLADNTSLRCIICSVDVKMDLRRAINKIALQGLGLCLDCIKSGDKTGSGKTCRVAHAATISSEEDQ